MVRGGRLRAHQVFGVLGSLIDILKDARGLHSHVAVEVIEVDDALSDLVKNERTTRSELRAYMNQRHLHGLRSAGFSKVASGETSVEEVLRVT